jgi:hypothetical protein
MSGDTNPAVGCGGARELQNIWQDGNSPRLTPSRPDNQYTSHRIGPGAEYRRLRASLAWLRELLAGDQVSLATLPDTSPRRRPTLPKVSWLEREDRWESVGSAASHVVADLHQRRRP